MITLSSPNSEYAIGLARAFGGAIIFGLPLLMTMEMWSLGFTAQPARLNLFLISNLVVLVGLSRFGGFERTSSFSQDVLDALAASGVGVIASAAVLGLFGLLDADMPAGQFVGMVAIQSVPASFGAMLARRQLSAKDSGDATCEKNSRSAHPASYGSQLFLMMAGALFLAFNVAPTEEMVLIGLKMTPWHSVAGVFASLAILHALVFAVGFAGQERAPEGYGVGRTFVAYTIPGYGIALLVSFYVLWTFGRADGGEISVVAGALIVLGFPASVGAAIARLVI